MRLRSRFSSLEFFQTAFPPVETEKPTDVFMIVCSCNVLSDQQIRKTCGAGQPNPQTPGQVYRCLGCSPQCGRCARTIKAMLADIRGLDAPDPSCGACPVACPSVTHGVGEVVDFIDDVVEVATIERRALARAD